MQSFSVSSRGLPTVQVTASNWVAALGDGLAQMGKDQGLERLACEVLPNGTVIARDIGSGMGFVVQQVDAAPMADEDLDLVELPVDAIEALDDESEEVFGEAPDDDEFDDDFDLILESETRVAAAIRTLQLAQQWIPAESGAVILEDRGYLRFVAATGPHSRRLTGVRLPLGTGVAGFSMAHQRAVVVDDAAEDERHCGEVDALTGYRTQQICVLPIQFAGTVYGVLELMNLPGSRRFAEDDVQRLQSLASVLGERLDEG